jgi:hypothetical protein
VASLKIGERDEKRAVILERQGEGRIRPKGPMTRPTHHEGAVGKPDADASPKQQSTDPANGEISSGPVRHLHHRHPL